jgi:hypothetical protein
MIHIKEQRKIKNLKMSFKKLPKIDKNHNNRSKNISTWGFPPLGRPGYHN